MRVRDRSYFTDRKRDLLISFSGGETSAFMAQWLLKNRRQDYNDIAVVFANTGQENEETLEFVDRCDKHFGLGVVWIEAVPHPGERRSPSAKVVNFETADRVGAVYESIIAKYGIPGPAAPHCTVPLKQEPIDNYVLDHRGWRREEYDTAIGIRIDEIDRMSSSTRRKIIYPLIRDVPMTKPQINAFWSEQPFRLRLKGYQGNCKWCWKKSTRKLITLLIEAPEKLDFPERMEETYQGVGNEFRKAERGEMDLPEGYQRRFFRGNASVADLRKMAEKAKDDPNFRPAEDDTGILPEFDEALDVGGGCGESCEVYAD